MARKKVGNRVSDVDELPATQRRRSASRRSTRARKVGASPGTLHATGEAHRATVRCCTIGPTTLRDDILQPDELGGRTIDEGCFEWIAVEGLGDVELLRLLGRELGLHALSLEDVLNSEHLPKLDVFDSYTFIVTKLCSVTADGRTFVYEPVALFLMDRRVVSVHAQQRDVLFAPVITRLQAGTQRIRSGADYLCYALIDLQVDMLYPVLDQVESEIEVLEESVLAGAERDSIFRIHNYRRSVFQLLKVVAPMREIVNGLRMGRSPFVRETTQLYYADVVDHTTYLHGTLEQYRDMLSGLVDLHMSIESNRMNQVMKVLTLIATIFIPLTFIAGVYGMNFHYMPELHQRWGYPAVLAVMVLVVIIMLMFFRRKHWF